MLFLSLRKDNGRAFSSPEDKFYADYQGNVFLKGEISSNKGKIGGWILDNYGLTSPDGLHRFKINSGLTTTAISILTAPNTYGSIGAFTLSDGTTGFGMIGPGTIAFRAKKGSGAYLKVQEDGYVELGPSVTLGTSSGTLTCNVPASRQSGIYARFA